MPVRNHRATDEMVATFRRMPGTCSCVADDPRENVRAALTAVLALADQGTVEELDELRALFDMQQKRMAEATARWRAEDPGARALTLPDLGALLQWLMDDADKARGATEGGVAP